MRIFDSEYKINFIDENNVFVGFSNGQSCCENFGYVINEKISTSSSEDQSEKFQLEDYVFDKTFSEEKESSISFKLINKKTDHIIYLTLYNFHNGYYSHGFEFTDGKKVIIQGAL